MSAPVGTVLHLSTYDITGGLFVGGLVGQNDGTIADSYATGAISSGSTVPESEAGGYGGLVGLNDTSGTILRSYATGAITLLGPISGYLDGGGLVGWHVDDGRELGSSGRGRLTRIDE